MNHDPKTNHQPVSDEELRQALLELHYGLLDDDEVVALKRRIETEPKVATLWANTLVVAGKFAEAAKINDSAEKTFGAFAKNPSDTSIPLTEDASPVIVANQAVSVDLPDADAPTSQLSSDAGTNRFLRLWLGSLATAATIAIALSGIRYWGQLPPSPQGELRVAVQPVAGVDASARNEFLVAVDRRAEQSSIDGSFDTSMSFVPATISFQVLSKGAVLFFGTAESSESGPCKISVPDDIAIPGDAVLHVDANPHGGGDQMIRLTVPIEPTRCLTFVSTDRPVYRPGETLFYRSVTLNRRTLASHLDVPIRYELVDASGAVVQGAMIEGVTERGVGNGAFIIPESAPGGTYRLIAKSLDGFFPDQSCELEVRRYRAVRLKTDLQFSKRSFSAGDRVEAALLVRRPDDQIPVAAPVRIKAVVDGNTIHQSTGTLGINGELSVSFDLPQVIRDGQGTLAIAIDDGSVTETAARPIPIHTGRAEVDFFPEGGYLVGGVMNRVYFAARDTDGKPIEIEGEVLSQAGRMVARIKTVRDGLGRFEFKPESGQRYSLRITSPLDLTETPWLPSVVEALPVLDTGTGVFAADDPISMTIRSTKRRPCIIRAVCRGELVGVKTMDLGIGDTSVTLPIQDRAAGVIRVTVLDTEGSTATPLVERLIYRRGEKQLNIAARVEGERGNETQHVHSPGQSVRMTLAVTDENGEPVTGAVLGVSVVDDAALSLRQKDIPSIKTHFLLTSEIQSPEDLEHANFYLSDSPEAVESLDLLLGTQGWRRFVSGTPGQSDESFRDALTRLLELDGQRAGLVSETQTNETMIREQIRAYRARLNAAWKGFIAEVRFVLIVIGVFWLVAFVVRPRKTTAAAAGLLLLGCILLAQAGCGASQQATGDRSEMAASDMEADFAQEMMAISEPEAGGIEQPDERSMDDDADLIAAAEEPRKPFVERVVRAFLGHEGAKAPMQVSSSRISSEQLERWARARDLDAKALADQLMEELRFPIRQYAHLHRPTEDGIRSDFAETLYWNPMMVTDSTGTATIRFDLSDSLTLFRVHVDGHGAGGRLGSGDGAVVTEIPIQVEPKLPLEVTGGDRIDLPVGLVNATRQDGTLHVAIETDDGLAAKRLTAKTSLGARGRATEVFSIDVAPTAIASSARIRVAASLDDGRLSDQVERSVKIVPDGFPFDLSQSGSLSKTVSVSPRLPESIVAGSLSGSVKIFPSTRSQLSAGLESILREPHGCFEQASASNYPNVMAFQLLRLDGVVDESTEKRTVSLLRRGYRKLTSYECSTLGYEWFGNDPGHEALSAFGLMQFSEMARFIDIDQEMLDRTRQWLLSRRDGKGGFQRNPRHLHVWSVQQEVVNAYLLWALSQADLAAQNPARTTTDLSAELDAMQAVAAASNDPYLIALSAITLANINRTNAASKLLDALVKMQNDDGSFEGKSTITQSGGISRTVETTSLVILALAANEPTGRQSADSDLNSFAAMRAAKWLVDNRRGGGFGSTQATVLALKALIAVHDQMADSDGGTVEVIAEGEVIDRIRWEGQAAECVEWAMPPALAEAFVADPKTQLSLRNRSGNTLPFAVEFSGRTTSPASDPNCPIAIRLSFAGQDHEASVRSGDTVDVIAEITNATDNGRPMTVSVIGIPGGLEPVIESLDKLRDSGQVDFYELRGREVVLYWRTFAPAESKRIPISCVAAVGGRYTGPPSRAYLYYTAESKSWHRPLIIEIE